MILEMTEAEREFRALFRELRKKYNLGMHLQTSIYERKDDLIEIWRCDEEGKRVETVCRIKRKDIEDCYKIAIGDLRFYDKRRREKEACGQA